MAGVMEKPGFTSPKSLKLMAMTGICDKPTDLSALRMSEM